MVDRRLMAWTGFACLSEGTRWPSSDWLRKRIRDLLLFEVKLGSSPLAQVAEACVLRVEKSGLSPGV